VGFFAASFQCQIRRHGANSWHSANAEALRFQLINEGERAGKFGAGDIDGNINQVRPGGW